jgi:hypothetical protein
MALRLRRGTDADRLNITPVEGELIYTTDLQELWIGDNITVGGNKIGGIIPQFLSDLSNVDAASPEIGQVLKWNGSSWIASDDSDTGVIEGSNYRINIVGENSEIIVDSNTNTVTGIFVGDGSGLTNLPIATDGSGVIEGSNYRINIVDDGSTLMVDTSTSTFTGNFVGDGSGLTNLPALNIQFDLTDVFGFSPPDIGDLLIFDGVTFQPQKIRTIEGADSTVIVNTFTNTFTGNFVGDGSGLTNLPISNIQSVFDLTDVFAFSPPDVGDILIFDGVSFQPQKIRTIEGADSTIIVDTFTNTFTGNFVGDGSGLTNLPTANILDLDGVFAVSPPDIEDILIFDGSNFQPQKIIRIRGEDSTVIVNTITNTFTGNFVGDGSGLTKFSTLNIIPTISASYINATGSTDGFESLSSNYRTSRGTNNNPLSVLSGDFILSHRAFAYDGEEYELSSAILHLIDPHATPVGVRNVPGSLALFTFTESADATGSNDFKGILIDSRGFLSINKHFSKADATLDVNGFAKLAILDEEPQVPTNGAIAIASGDGWDPLNLGLPAKQQMVVYLGGGWRQISVEP